MKNFTKYALMLIPILGWIYIGIGCFFPFKNTLLHYAWIVAILLCFGAHALQLLITIPLAKKQHMGMAFTVFMTLVFGAAWWKPLLNNIRLDETTVRVEAARKTEIRVL